MARQARAQGAAKGAPPAPQIEMRAVGELTPHVRNARTHPPEQIAAIAKSIERFGFTIPVLVSDAGTVIAGHGRLLAAARLKLDRVPVIVARGWSDEQCRAYMLADNKLAEGSGWDQELLGLEIAELGLDRADDDTLGALGFTTGDIEKLLASADAPSTGRGASKAQRPEDVLPKGREAAIYGGATAIARASTPLRFWRSEGYITGECLDFGCGKEGHEFAKYDAFEHPDPAPLLRRWDTVMCNYVLNVQPAIHLVDQVIALTRLLLKPEGHALFAVRNDIEETYVSRSGTQIGASREWWEERLGAFYWVECVEEKRFFGFNCLPMP